jgi:hypothetical protein
VSFFSSFFFRPSVGKLEGKEKTHFLFSLFEFSTPPGGGASLGPEGPAVDVGLSVARGTAAAFFLKDKARAAEPLLAAGAGAGVAAGFGAPLSGAFFAVETVLLRRWSAGDRPSFSSSSSSSSTNSTNNTGLAVSAVLLAAVLAALASSSGLGIGLGPPRVAVPPYVLPSAAELPLALVLGALCGGVARGARKAEKAAAAAAAFATEEQDFPAVLLPAVAGLLTGILALAYPEVLYQGFGNVNAILSAGVGSSSSGGGGTTAAAMTEASAAAAAAAARDGLFAGPDGYGPALLFQIAAAKVAATALCRGKEEEKSFFRFFFEVDENFKTQPSFSFSFSFTLKKNRRTPRRRALRPFDPDRGRPRGSLRRSAGRDREFRLFFFGDGGRFDDGGNGGNGSLVLLVLRHGRPRRVRPRRSRRHALGALRRAPDGRPAGLRADA